MPAVWAEGTASEISVQLAITQRAAGTLLALAWDLRVKLPRTSEALRDGVIDEYKAGLIAAQCVNLTPAEARQAEDILFRLPGIETMTWWQIRDRIARAVIEVNPDAARRARQDAARTRRVEVRGEGSGNAMIAARELPPDAVLRIDQAITARALQLRKAGVKGGLNELRVLAFLERWNAIDPRAPRDTGGTGTGDSPPWDPAHDTDWIPETTSTTPDSDTAGQNEDARTCQDSQDGDGWRQRDASYWLNQPSCEQSAQQPSQSYVRSTSH
jgi:hypothetical protein